MLDMPETTTKLIDVGAVLQARMPSLKHYPAVIVRFLTWGLRTLVNEDRINQFLQKHGYLKGSDFIDQVFDELQLDYLVRHDEIKNIPVTGRVLIVANHPLGGLDGLTLLRLIGKTRRDVSIVVNELLLSINSLNNMFLAVDAFGGETHKADLERIITALNQDRAVIIFPAGAVSRAGPKGIRDCKWLSGFLRIAEKTSAPILPIHIRARNSVLFYLVARLSATLSMLMLPREMTRFKGKISLTIGQPIPIADFELLPMGRREKAQLVNRHLRRLGRGKPPVFKTPKGIIHPVSRKTLRDELKSAEKLGVTADNKHILLVDYAENTAVMDEIGRLRELTFRSVGEGTGKSKDIDQFDHYYRHLLLWDDDRLEIAGAYRLGEIWRWQGQPKTKLYSHSLFDYQPSIQPLFAQGLELGRSFVQPQYWGLRSLDYLWQGIGVYLASQPQVRYLFGPVSLYNNMPKPARDLLVHFYKTHFADPDHFALPAIPYVIDADNLADLRQQMPGLDFDMDHEWLRSQLGFMGLNIPTLFKQYADVCTPGGVRFCCFSIDPAFNHCVDGLVMVDIHQLKSKKRARYIGGALTIGAQR